MKAATLRMSKLDMLAAGMWKPETSVFMAAPCSTNREAIWRRHGLYPPSSPAKLIALCFGSTTAALSKILYCIKRSIVEYFSGANFPINFMELIRITWHLHLPFPSSRHDHLAKPGQRVPFGREMPIPRCPNEEQNQSRERGGGGGPKPQRPHGLVFEVDQNRVGKQRPEIQGQVEVAEEGHLGVALLRVILVELVGPERRHVGLVPAVPQRH
nr:Os03g0823550 [Ipomoea batatas]GMD71740.1 Os03g0823550 [Ipomoea batatas]